MAQVDTSPVALSSAQVQQGAELLARVFQHDPMMQYLVADTSRLLDKPMRLYRAAIRMGLLSGAVHTTPGIDGVAVWISPGHTDFTFGQLLRSGFLTAALSMGLKSLGRFMQSANYFENLKKQTITDPHWLLLFLGVEPSQQGKGLGATLMQPILDRADAEGLPCYLESTNERNLTFYKRHGFKVSTQGQVPKDGPQIWFMLREPRQP
jgi:ribosomal protein S18 acetylase RimI-like enzyme